MFLSPKIILNVHKINVYETKRIILKPNNKRKRFSRNQELRRDHASPE